MTGCTTVSVCLRLEWVRRWEIGRGGRDHFHLLIRLPNRCRTRIKTTLFRLQNLWHQKLGYGIADARSIDSNDGIAGYIAKCVNEYEETRFNTDQYRSVVFSHAAIRRMCRGSRLLQRTYRSDT